MNAVPLNKNQHALTKDRVVTILGATGSIGQSTVDLVRRSSGKFRVEALTAHSNVGELAKLARELNVKFAAVADEKCYADLKDALAGSGIEAGAGESALVEAALRPANWVMAAMSGAAGLKPAMAAAGRGVVVALANKECLVCAGEVFMRHAAANGATVLPVDSEHNALFQAMGAGRREDLVRVILTASGGPFRSATLAQIENATVEQALKHPNWSMGRKITIDSATMFNKALEIIEAYHLFELRADQIDVLVHPQSIIHGLVEFSDRSVVAQMGAPDMRTPIAHCLAWPERIDGPANRLDLAQIGQLTFEAPDPVRFPALRLVQEALVAGGAVPTILNAANEVAVAAFLDRKIGFGGIPLLVEATMSAMARQGNNKAPASADEALNIDYNARNVAATLAPQLALKAS
ncbi:1-deoxy-D-xylulose-5-phosphate reductoisomerase [Bradyrhizobium sp. SYSU BS000235]|uniref:1-deoxy-D-xylulose-5-phosphate reductoisomerase n=1 Tax=Bradyrhizobium sp. SYSU BS000235 TaxID=3411332 RepID=UPI003C785700